MLTKSCKNPINLPGQKSRLGTESRVAKLILKFLIAHGPIKKKKKKSMGVWWRVEQTGAFGVRRNRIGISLVGQRT
jgi:hypothetical protein